MTAPRISTGRLYGVDTICPGCGRLELLSLDLTAILTTPTDGPSTLKVKAASKALEHWCTPAGTPDPVSLFDVNDTTP